MQSKEQDEENERVRERVSALAFLFSTVMREAVFIIIIIIMEKKIIIIIFWFASVVKDRRPGSTKKQNWKAKRTGFLSDACAC